MGPPYHWTFRGNCAVVGRRILHGTARHAQPIGRVTTGQQPTVIITEQIPGLYTRPPSFYTKYGAKVFGAFLDAGKAFDKGLHNGLLKNYWT